MINVQSVSLINNRELFIAGQSFALSDAKTLSEFQRQATLPELTGIAARVLIALQNRIGHSSLAIAHLASDLNLSKRTLQRRLQQEDINFAQLRDKLRFNHAISYLIEQKISIDSISSNLDFSDRTSFTNAFKRWTELSPSLFRKLYRDYI
jgi:AraC-like DNA-binding protein|tara:strand:- start:1890 stop:2342 length:453 start_codon:yes stop_codon:yes gene_type:complete